MCCTKNKVYLQNTVQKYLLKIYNHSLFKSFKNCGHSFFVYIFCLKQNCLSVCGFMNDYSMKSTNKSLWINLWNSISFQLNCIFVVILKFCCCFFLHKFSFACAQQWIIYKYNAFQLSVQLSAMQIVIQTLTTPILFSKKYFQSFTSHTI